VLDMAGEVSVLRFATLAAADRLEHAVSTRLGGASLPPFDALNLSWTTGDDRQAVEENHQRLCSGLGIPRSAVVSPRQVHGAIVQRVGAADRGRIIPDCDALVTDVPGVALLLRFADCVPILLFDGEHGAIGLAHAGWRGTVAGIAAATVRRMAQEFGSQPERIVAALGPAIGPCCYTVGADVVTAVTQSLGDGADLLRKGPFRTLAAGRGGSTTLDLWEANRRALVAVGVTHIEACEICTACHNDSFFSYRAGRGRTGHHGALMYIRE
jgi:YfiH family protein